MTKMNDKITVNYKDQTITYDEFANKWSIPSGEYKTKDFVSLSNAKAYIDKIEKQEHKGEFERFPVIIGHGYNTYTKASVTSCVDGEYWVVDEGGGRRKLHPSQIFMLTAENIRAFDQIFAINNEINQLTLQTRLKNNQITEIAKNLVSMDIIENA
jgi:hypothetical protein